MRHPLTLVACTVLLSLSLVSVARAQEGSTVPLRELEGDGMRDIHRLGGSTALYKPPLTTVASLKAYGQRRNHREAARIAAERVLAAAPAGEYREFALRLLDRLK